MADTELNEISLNKLIADLKVQVNLLKFDTFTGGKVPLCRMTAKECEETNTVLNLLQCLDELAAYRNVGTVKDCANRKELTTPKPPEIHNTFYLCPRCHAIKGLMTPHKFCCNCGQALAW